MFKDYLLKDLAQPKFAKDYLEAAQDFDKDDNIEILLLPFTNYTKIHIA